MRAYIAGIIPPSRYPCNEIMAASPAKSLFCNISNLFAKRLAFLFNCGNNSRISMLFEFPDKSKGCSMSLQTGTVNAALKARQTVPVGGNKFSDAIVFNRFIEAPTVANTSVSRQTGLAGIWKKSIDPISLTPHPQSGVASTMRINTLVVCPKNRRAAPSVTFPRFRSYLARVGS